MLYKSNIFYDLFCGFIEFVVSCLLFEDILALLRFKILAKGYIIVLIATTMQHVKNLEVLIHFSNLTHYLLMKYLHKQQ